MSYILKVGNMDAYMEMEHVKYGNMAYLEILRKQK